MIFLAPLPAILETMETHVYAGFLGGLASATALQPLDLLKTRVQQAHTNGVLSAIRSLGSIKEAWRGTLPSVIRTSIGASLYLSSLSKLRALKAGTPTSHRPSSVLPRLGAFDNILTGATARSIVGFIMMPITVIKVRFESNLYDYKSISSAFRDVVNGPRGWKGLFSGYGATISRDAPYAGLYMVFYDKTKDLLQFQSLPGPFVNSVAAMGASVLATTLTAPFDTIKTRIQVSSQKLTFTGAFKEIISGGWKSLFDGMGLRLTRKALSSGISWCIYEEIVKSVSNSKKSIIQ